MARICLITPFHVSFQPRTIREADTLDAAGHDVRVLAVQRDDDLVAHDTHLLRRRRWRLQSVDLRRHGPSPQRWLAANLWARAHRLAFDAGVRTAAVAARAYLRGFGRLVRAAASEPVDWYIAHTQAALPVAIEAARRRPARIGFDCEDLLADAGTDPRALVEAIERTHLRRCDYVSAPSRDIAQELAQRYSIPSPLVLHNVFPLRLADGLPEPARRVAPGRLRLHWSGQTIGPGRGLEEAIDAAGRLDEPVEIHLRGRIAPPYERALRRHAAHQQTPPALALHGVIDHDEVIRAMADYDVGLSLERSERGNASRTIANKLFSFVLAGLAVAVTDTPGHREAMDEMPHAGFVYRAGDPAGLASGLSRWQKEGGELRRAQTAAWDAARARFCWEREEAGLLRVLGLS